MVFGQKLLYGVVDKPLWDRSLKFAVAPSSLLGKVSVEYALVGGPCVSDFRKAESHIVNPNIGVPHKATIGTRRISCL